MNVGNVLSSQWIKGDEIATKNRLIVRRIVEFFIVVVVVVLLLVYSIVYIFEVCYGMYRSNAVLSFFFGRTLSHLHESIAENRIVFIFGDRGLRRFKKIDAKVLLLEAS